MFRRTLFAIAFLLLACTLYAKDRVAFIYYYGWYGNPGYDTDWSHWQENQHQPPWDVASSYYPKLGAYSSNDPAIIDQHMSWIASTGIRVLIYSWWGKEDRTHEVARLVLDAAAQYNLSVSFLIEPYEGRTTKSICEDIEFLIAEFGQHSAFFRMSKPTSFGNTEEQRPFFFIYNPDYPEDDLRLLSDTVHQSANNSILLLHSTDAGLVERAHADGIFAYEAVVDIVHFYDGIQKTVAMNGGIFVPCVAPGFSIDRFQNNDSPLHRTRNKGKSYDRWWKKTIIADPEFVAVISFNEWHEGTQIEPAIRIQKVQPPYLSYEKAYSKTGVPAQFSYLRRTARWIQLFLSLP
jgi:glycoprotein endo-alpha-1,2-mannosidase